MNQRQIAGVHGSPAGRAFDGARTKDIRFAGKDIR
jgi:hypothetical protein